MVLMIVSGLNTYAQIPTDGLIGYWPFNGNATDESGNGHDCINYGAQLTKDRFGNTNQAYYFDSTYMVPKNLTNITFQNEFTINFWVLNKKREGGNFVSKHQYGSYNSSFAIYNEGITGCGPVFYTTSPSNTVKTVWGKNMCDTTTWHMITASYKTPTMKLYIDGALYDTINNTSIKNTTLPIVFGGGNSSPSQIGSGTIAFMDDIRIYSRILTSKELSSLFNEGICIQNITVTDTLVINSIITSYNPLSYQNTIKIYPNPSNDYINIDFGNNYAAMNGYLLKINNSLSQTVYTTTINEQHTTINLASWTENGLYFVHLIDTKGNTVDIRKIILQ